MADVFAVASKEFSDIVRSKRFIILVVIFGLIMTIAMATIYVQVRGSMPRMFIMMVYNILVPTLLYFAPVLGVALGCDTISGEREKGTPKLILSQPVYRDTVINGKWSYGSATTCLIYAGPNILVLLIMTALAFIFSYITFTRQEVR